jgi:hypothetical protein
MSAVGYGELVLGEVSATTVVREPSSASCRRLTSPFDCGNDDDDGYIDLI